MLEVINISNQNRWNEVINSFAVNDIYYSREYNIALQKHGDGEPFLIYHADENAKIAYVMFQCDIADSQLFAKELPEKAYFDWTSPYGYGGPLYEGNICEDYFVQFQKELFAYCKEHTIVTQFFRYHPQLKNNIFVGLTEDKKIKQTVEIDTRVKVDIVPAMKAECRNRIRKAVASGVNIICDDGENIDSFLEIYNETMNFHEADDYYYFNKSYFTYLIEEYKGHVKFFYALKDNDVISAGMFLYNDKFMHYHLGGTKIAYRQYAPFNLVIKEAAEWAAEKQIEKLHLGGGVSDGDSLFSYKKKYNPQGVMDFVVGRTIFLPEEYEELLEIRRRKDDTFQNRGHYLIEYRTP